MPAILYCYSNMGKHYIHEYLTLSDNEGLNLKFDNQQKTFFGLSFLDSEVEECFVFDIISEAPESEKDKILMLNAKEPQTDVKASTRNSAPCFTVYTPMIFLTF